MKETHIIRIFEDITDELALKTVSDMFDNLNSDIQLHINSDGGNIDSAITICNAIKFLQGRGYLIDTVVCGKSCSSALNITVCGNIRYASENSIFMIHPVRYELPEDYSHVQDAGVSFWTKKSEEFLEEVIIKLKSKYRNDIRKKLINGYWFTTKEALQIGLIDKIWK